MRDWWGYLHRVAKCTVQREARDSGRVSLIMLLPDGVDAAASDRTAVLSTVVVGGRLDLQWELATTSTMTLADGMDPMGHCAFLRRFLQVPRVRFRRREKVV